MKKLMRVKLINWHKFSDETLTIGDATLISGDNGSGKSTILDAIQYVLTTSTNHFNKAAQERGKRTINSYVRGKTGTDSHPYIRTGTVTSHIALEFYDEKMKQYFIIGVVIDSENEHVEPRSKHYMIKGKSLNEVTFIKKKEIYTAPTFKKFNNVNYFKTKKEAQEKMMNQFGRLDHKFFELIPKALAFKPINNIRDFVNSYVLDEKSIDVNELKSNVRLYQEFEKTLQDIKVRLEELEKINKAYATFISGKLRVSKYDYFILRAQVENLFEVIKQKNKELEDTKYKLNYLTDQLNDALRAKNQQQQLVNQLQVELQSNESYLALANEKNLLEGYLTRQKELERKVKELNIAFQHMKSNINSLVKYDHEHWQEDIHLFDSIDGNYEFTSSLNQLKEKIEKRRNELSQEELKLKLQKDELSIRIQDNKAEIEQLQNKKPIYPAHVITLQREINHTLLKANKTTEAKILCELLEIKDQSWTNAIEGYLNTQRFYLIVEEEDYDLASSTYQRLKQKTGLFGVGLINTQKLYQYDKAEKGTLAEEISTTNIYARRFINMILGKVHKADNLQQLKQHAIGITKDGMRYQNHTLMAIDPKIYAKPYIGSGALEIQLKMAMNKAKELHSLDQQLDKQIKTITNKFHYLEVGDIYTILSKLDDYHESQMNDQRIKNSKLKIKELEKNSEYIEKMMLLERYEEDLKQMNQKYESFISNKAVEENRINDLSLLITNQQLELTANQEELDLYIEKIQDHLDEFKEEYEQKITGNYISFIQNYSRQKEGYVNRVEKFKNELVDLMHKYAINHQFGGAANVEGYQDYYREYRILSDSKATEYEQKVIDARNKAEEQFRTQFLSRMQENINEAKASIKELNKALKGIEFNKELYEFTYSPKGKYEAIYRMIMDENNTNEGVSLFSTDFENKYRKEIDELFDKLNSDVNTSNDTLEEYTDYRNYMDYDIKIINTNDDSFMYYSAVSQEKSGGETQTPFYITITASFKQLYTKTMGDDNSIGLILMDEAFNNMDDARINGVLTFMRQTGLQLIISTPSEKIQYIAPSTDTTLLVFSQNNTSFVEVFKHEL